MTEQTLGSIVGIRGRFQRSVQLVRDWQEQRALEDYLVTPTARELALQIVTGIVSPDGSRTWSITGPYGTGKSAFALFLVDLLANDPPRHSEARAIADDSEFIVKPFTPVLAVGERASMVPCILQRLSESLVEIDPTLSAKIAEATANQELTNGEVIALVEAAATAAAEAGSGGLLLIIDEFGKFLEYAAQNSDSEDLLILQELAELAARSEVPIVFITILHSAFAEYLSILDEARRAEWRKVQGRFADVAFLEPPEQFLRLTGAAIEWKENSNTLSEYIDEVKKVVEASIFDETRKRFPIESLLPDCAPLHPLTALLLWPLFRSKLAQNERSLFAFLIDRGPYGFQEFLSLVPLGETPLQYYRLDRLYDYIVTTLGPAVFLGDRSRRWAGIQHACDRIAADAPPLAEAVVKAVGLLSLYGPSVGLRPSQEVLEQAFSDQAQASEAIAYLQGASILVYRRHNGTFALWEGSDVDLDASYSEALRYIRDEKPATRLKRLVELRPIVAKAHYIRAGTLRYFLVDIIDGSKEALEKALEKPVSLADGKIVFVLTLDPGQRRELITLAQQLTTNADLEHQLRLFAFPKQMVGLENALREVEAWSWVLDNVAGLQGDPVGRQEVKTRISHARSQLQDIAGAVLGLRGYLFEPSTSEWVQAGQIHEPTSVSAFQRWLSQLSDNVYHAAPTFHNELLNRESISAAATAGRRLLIEAMVEHESEPQLGITGTPSEYSMYRSLLEIGGFHREVDGAWRFVEPNSDWQPIWNAMKEFLENTASGRRPLAELFSILKKPPYGLREGPIPVLIAALLLTYRNQVALYEDGLFVPALRIEVFERLTRVHENFEVQQYRVDETAHEAYSAVEGVLRSLNLTEELSTTPDLLTIVKPMVVFAARLSDFSRRTKRVDPPEAIEIRNSLLKTQDPYTLIFEDLPCVLGISVNRRESIPEFANKLKSSLIALQQAYPRLLDGIENHIRNMFSLDGNSVQVRQRLKERATPLVGYAGDRTLDLFVREASRLGDRDWREVLARVVNKGIPPSHWSDHDFVDFQVRLQRVASDFVRLEELVAEQVKTGASKIIRIGVLDGKHEEAREVISIPSGHEKDVDRLVQRIRDLLATSDINSSDGRRIRLAALSRVTQEYLQPNGEEADD